MNDSTPEQLSFQSPIIKLCECGCGNPAPISNYTNARLGYKKGKPTRFLPGHIATRPLSERFWGKVDKSGGPDACWLWTGATIIFGYGRIRVNRVNKLAHRISWELHNGSIPEGMNVLHSCDRPPCVNPTHLFLGTLADNIKDRDEKGRCSKGESCALSRFVEKDVVSMRARYAGGEKVTSIARDYGASSNTVYAIVYRRTWKHIP